MTTLDAVILAGGRGSRMGGVTKPMLEVSGETLLRRSVDAARVAGCSLIVVAGPVLDESLDVTWVREEPTFGGPIAGLAAALPVIVADWSLILPADLAHPQRAVRALLRARSRDGACLVDANGRAQWLTGVYRTEALRRRLLDLGDTVRDSSARRLISELEIALIPGGPGAADDIDTWDHLRRARGVAAADKETDMAEDSPRTLPPEALDAWAGALRERFGLNEEDLPISLILDLARDVANGVARPAAPFSAFVAGLVAGRAGGTPDQIRDAVAEITALAGEWDAR